MIPQKLIKKMILIAVSIFFIPIKHLIRKRQVVILQTYNRQIYCDNTRYLYEFLSNKKCIDVYWVTDNTRIKKYISDKGWKYISWSSPIKMLKIALTAKIVIDNGTKFFNIFNILNLKSVIKISLQHGCGPKITLRDPRGVHVSIRHIKDINAFNYINFPSDYSTHSMGRNMYHLPDVKVVSFGYPRCDQFFDENRVEKSFQEKKIAKELTGNFTDKDKIILYTPTWRPYQYDAIPLKLMNSFHLIDFNSWLRDNNLFFFFTVHSHAGDSDWEDELDRMVLIDKALHPMFDINEFMLETSILLNDYSTTTTDFSLLKRPQLFYMPDYELYSTETGFFEEYREILPGKEVFNYDELIKEIKSIISDEDFYSEKYANERENLLQKYYDRQKSNACSKSYEFIKQKLSGV